MQNRLTIKDIARLSGVGKSTVSRVLNHTGSVSPQTRERVEAVIRSQGFIPSKSARAMRSQSDRVVGIIVSRLDSPSENQALRSMLPMLYQQGFDPIIMESRFKPHLIKEHLNMLRQRNVDGVILFGFSALQSAILQPWQEKMVVIAYAYQGISSVCYDDEGAINLLIARLHQQGHQHIAYLGVQPADATTGMRRYQAYLSACEKLQLIPYTCLGELSYQSGFQLAAKVITSDTSALICASDTIALGASKYLQLHHTSPVQVCGIGNTPMLRFLFPDTFSVDMGYARAGLQAAQQLLGQLKGELATQNTIVPCQFS